MGLSVRAYEDSRFGRDGSTLLSNASPDWLQPPADQQGLRRYLATIRERLPVVLAVLVIVTGAAVAYVATATKVYQAQAEMLITPVPSDATILGGLGLLQQSADPTTDLQTAAQLVDTQRVAERTSRVLDNGESAQQILDDISVAPIPASNILAVTAKSSDPTTARDTANAFADAGAAQRTVSLHKRIDKVLPKLQAQLNSSTPGTGSGAVATQIAQLETLRAGGDPTIRVETRATTPSSPSSPRPFLTIAAGVLGGLVLGLGAAFALQALDPKLRREEQLRQLYRLPILTRIARQPHSGDPLSPDKSVPATREAYRTLRATLSPATTPEGHRSILVTGSSPAEGKTTTAINLAASIARGGNSVILIEADLRRPSIGKALGVAPEHGLVSVLIEQTELADALVTTSTYGPDLKLLLADHSGPGIAELLSLPIARRLLEEATISADAVVIDSPPLTDVIDALPLAEQVDDVVIVVRLGTSRLKKLHQLGELLAGNGIRPTGFAVVGVPRARSTGYYYAEGAESPRRLVRPPS